METERVALSVVVIGLNEGARLFQCLRTARLDLDRFKLPFELIYVDSASTDGSIEQAERMGATTLQAGRNGAARARNMGWRAARGEFVQFLDGDMCVEPGWFKSGWEAIQEPGVGAVFGQLRELHVKTNPYCAAFGLDWNKPAGETAFFGGAVLVRRTILAATGGYDETLRVGEDPELALRFRKAGYRILSVAAPMATHDLGIHSFADYWKRAKAVGVSRALVYKKNRSLQMAWRALGSAASIAVVMLLAALAAWFPYGLPILAGLIALRWFRLVARDLLKGRSWIASFAHGSHLTFGKLPEAQGALGALLRR